MKNFIIFSNIWIPINENQPDVLNRQRFLDEQGIGVGNQWDKKLRHQAGSEKPSTTSVSSAASLLTFKPFLCSLLVLVCQLNWPKPFVGRATALIANIKPVSNALSSEAIAAQRLAPASSFVSAAKTFPIYSFQCFHFVHKINLILREISVASDFLVLVIHHSKTPQTVSLNCL